MEDKRLIYLYHRFIEQTATSEELVEFDEYLSLPVAKDKLSGLLDAEYTKVDTIYSDIAEERKQKVLQQLTDQFAAYEGKRKDYKLWPRIVAVAAAAVALIVLGVYFFNYRNNEILKQVQDDVVVNDVSPGQVGATLTLASGKKIRLTDAANGELAKEAGVTITKSEDGELTYEIKGISGESNKINTLSTANGETYKLRLPDGSFVWLNSASSLTYSANLVENGQRRVKLQGEGYFEIFKDKKHPFIVSTDKQDVEVLGTHFNVNAYSDEPAIATTLIEGSVKVTSAGKRQLLKPNEQAINNGDEIKVLEANIENITDWKDGDFYFERVDFRSVMRKIARWYDVEIVYDPSVPENITSNGLISRNNKLSTVLKSIEKSGQVHFKIEGKTVYVSK